VAGQTYATHRHRPRLWLFAFACAALGLLVMVLFLLRQPGIISAGLLFLAMGVMCAVLLLRRYALNLQDRIIRLEMRGRLAGLGREADIGRLSMPQIIALRFASDREISGLVDRALAERLTPDQIKRAVTEWQADDMRT
jgi:hypothetical protein